MINNLPYATTIELSSGGHNKLPIKPIDQLAANLVRLQAEKLEKPAGKLEKIAESLAKGHVGMHSSSSSSILSNGVEEDLRLQQQQQRIHQRGMDLSTSPRGWEASAVSDLSAGNVNVRPVDFSGMDLSSRKVVKELPSPAGYRPQDYLHQQQREMDLSTRKAPVKMHPNLVCFILKKNQFFTIPCSKRPLTPMA